MKTISTLLVSFTMSAIVSEISNYTPSAVLLLLMVVVINLDFLTDIIKLLFNRVPITLDYLEKTLIKFVQYAGAIIIGIILTFLANHSEIPYLLVLGGWLTNGLVIFIIYIKITSILKNLIEANPNADIAKYFFIPLHKIITFQIHNNIVKKQADNGHT